MDLSDKDLSLFQQNKHKNRQKKNEVVNTDAVIGDHKVTDVELIHMAFKGFFAEIPANVEQVNFEE